MVSSTIFARNLARRVPLRIHIELPVSVTYPLPQPGSQIHSCANIRAGVNAAAAAKSRIIAETPMSTLQARAKNVSKQLRSATCL